MGNYHFVTAAWFGTLLKQLKGNKTRRPAKEPCLKQHIKKQTRIYLCTLIKAKPLHQGRPSSCQAFVILNWKKMACASYYGSMFSISPRLLCHYLLKSPPSVYVDSERGTCTLNWDVLRSEGGSRYLFILDCACSSLLGRKLEKYTIFWCTQNSVCFITMLNI